MFHDLPPVHHCGSNCVHDVDLGTGEQTGGGIVITPVEHATMIIRSPGKTIYVDPVGKEKDYASFPKPDIILITHMHSDHFDPGLVLSLKTDDTAAIGPKTVIEALEVGQTVTNGESLTIGGVPIDVVPAYNLSAARTGPSTHAEQPRSARLSSDGQGRRCSKHKTGGYMVKRTNRDWNYEAQVMAFLTLQDSIPCLTQIRW